MANILKDPSRGDVTLLLLKQIERVISQATGVKLSSQSQPHQLIWTPSHISCDKSAANLNQTHAIFKPLWPAHSAYFCKQLCSLPPFLLLYPLSDLINVISILIDACSVLWVFVALLPCLILRVGKRGVFPETEPEQVQFNANWNGETGCQISPTFKVSTPLESFLFWVRWYKHERCKRHESG